MAAWVMVDLHGKPLYSSYNLLITDIWNSVCSLCSNQVDRQGDWTLCYKWGRVGGSPNSAHWGRGL